MGMHPWDQSGPRRIQKPRETPMFDIKTIEAEAKSELAEERGKAAKGKIKDSH